MSGISGLDPWKRGVEEPTPPPPAAKPRSRLWPPSRWSANHWLFAILCLTLIALGAEKFYGEVIQERRERELQAAVQPFEPGEQPPEILLPDAAGNSHRVLAEMEGKPVVIYFLTGCRFCTHQLLQWRHLAQALRENDLPVPEMVAIFLLHPDEVPAELLEDAEGASLVLYDPRYEAARAYGIGTTPRGYLVGAEGEIQFYNTFGLGEFPEVTVAEQITVLASILGLEDFIPLDPFGEEFTGPPPDDPD